MKKSSVFLSLCFFFSDTSNKSITTCKSGVLTTWCLSSLAYILNTVIVMTGIKDYPEDLRFKDLTANCWAFEPCLGAKGLL